ncbi:MBL fold metallo-hydrolase [Neobacillus massiliamazoniensis]|uniref:Beta-lactamase domain-containing protein n=1 Tax=Neobacillus massiliamazoniensis TaxID=1499688 RepID=A0A0U1NT23_9BACI|nr:MBL fold metallo-hydrolase [Neobacillus massiliamazoniensis]CRK81194.1 beta-lactamase domain-containing protein [Neobacillus massiliamazoniensis]
MRIGKGIETIELVANMMGRQMVIHPTLIWDDNEIILVDTGIPGQLEEIREAIEKAGVPFNKLTKVILTHQDIDHIGSLPEILKAADHKIEVFAHEADKPYIEGVKPFLKMNPERVAKMMESLPEDERQKIKAMFGAPLTAKVDKTISDGEVLPYCGGITVIFTPGHTPGHISLYHQQSKTLITGDALVAANGIISGPNPQATPDMETALQSIKKFTKYDIETVICYHGGVIKENANKQLLALANS